VEREPWACFILCLPRAAMKDRQPMTCILPSLSLTSGAACWRRRKGCRTAWNYSAFMVSFATWLYLCCRLHAFLWRR